jgi:anti-anti-sigma factor
LFSVELVHDGDATATLMVRGELDMVTAPGLLDRAEGAPSSDLVIDLSRVTFMDSTGLRALWSLRQAVNAQGHRALLRSPSRSVMRVLQTTRLDKVFDYIDGDGGSAS